MRALAFSPDSARLATGSGAFASIYDLHGLEAGPLHADEVARFRHTTSVSDVAFSPDGSRLATAAGKTGIVWDLPSSGEVARLAHAHLSIWAVVFSPTGDRLATAGGDDETARVWTLPR